MDQGPLDGSTPGTFFGWYLTHEAGTAPVRFYAPNLHGWRSSRTLCQPSFKEAVEGFAVLWAAKHPLWIGELHVRRIKLEGHILAKWKGNFYKERAD